MNCVIGDAGVRSDFVDSVRGAGFMCRFLWKRKRPRKLTPGPISFRDRFPKSSPGSGSDGSPSGRKGCCKGRLNRMHECHDGSGSVTNI